MALADDLLMGRLRPADQPLVPGDARWMQRQAVARQIASHPNTDRLLGLLNSLAPADPTYTALRQALAIETDPAKRTALVATLERRRWLPRPTPVPAVVVNIPAYELIVTSADGSTRLHRVIVGKLQTPTPIFAATMTAFTINPWWVVPERIAREKIWPQIRRDRRTISRMGYVIDGLKISQRPGPRNALGQIKLLMANPHGVLIHDTPDRQLFNQEKRALSNGCIRAEHPAAVAQTLAGTAVNVAAAIASGDTRTLALPEAVPVWTTYQTAVITDEGGVRFLDDLYGLDPALASALGKPVPAPLIGVSFALSCSH